MKSKVSRRYDVAVSGGGVAGISAAMAAAREGKRVVLFEREYMLGGLGTAGLITFYLPLCDGYGKQVSFGIAEELLRLSIKHGAEDDYPANWLDGVGTRTEHDPRYMVRYNPQVFAILAEQLLLKLGVKIMYGSYVTDCKVSDGKIKYLTVNNKSGRTNYYIKSVVDATGDCDIAKFAGAPTDTFRQGNVLAAWYYYANKNGYDLNTLGYSDIPDEEKAEGEKRETLIKRRFGGLDASELSEMMCISHKTILNDWLKRKAEDESLWPVTIATIPQIRMTRKLVGEYVLSQTEEHTYFEDSIGMVSNWKRRGPVFEVPFRTLYSAKVKNLITAGRCTSVNETLWDVMRVIPCCAVTGQAAGCAAAMTDDFTSLDVKLLQEKLTASGVVLHESDLK